MLLDGPFRGGYWYTKGYLADRDCRIAGIQEEPEGQIEVLNVGDSLANIAITPLELYRDFGITSYVMGRDLQKCTETYYAIKLAIQNSRSKSFSGKCTISASTRRVTNRIWSAYRNMPNTGRSSSNTIMSGKG